MVARHVLLRILPLTDLMVDLKVEERVARVMEVLVAKAKVNIRNPSPSGITNQLISTNGLVVPLLPFANLRAHLPVQECIAECSGLADRYVEEAVRQGLRLEWVADFDGE